MTFRRRRLSRSFAALAAAMSLVLSVAGAVAAHHAEIVASMDCDGLVTYTATAWKATAPTPREPTPTSASGSRSTTDRSTSRPPAPSTRAMTSRSAATYSAPGADR